MRKHAVLLVVLLFAFSLLVVWPLAGRELAQEPNSAPELAVVSAPPVAITFVPPTPEVISPTIITAVSLDPVTGSAPAITSGPLAGEVTAETAVLWARGNQAGDLFFSVAPAIDADFSGDVQQVRVPVNANSDFTGDTLIKGLEPSTGYYYRVALQAGSKTSDYVQGYFTTAPATDEAIPFNFTFGACLGGQGFCRDPQKGWTIFNTMLAQQPDFFLSTGDSVYVDSACTAPNNVAGSEGPFSDLAGFRNRYQYHLADPNYANFLAQTPIYVTWDDHEIRDDFGGPALSKVNPKLFQEGTQTFFEYWPIQPQDGKNTIYRSFNYGQYAQFILLDLRSYRDPNVNWDPNPRTLAAKTMLGPEQYAWLQDTLRSSTATWKFIVTSAPLSYPTGFPQPEVDGRDGWANYTDKSGYETELMSLLFFVESHAIQNVVFLTGDTHWPFAISYDPDHDGTANFYELGASPMSAITLPPVEKPDPTFNPTVLYAEGTFNGTFFNFGHIAIDEEGNLTFQVFDREGKEHYSLTLEPK